MRRTNRRTLESKSINVIDFCTIIYDATIAIKVVVYFDKKSNASVIINALDFNVKIFRKTICFVDKKDETNFLDITTTNFCLEDIKSVVKRSSKYAIWFKSSSKSHMRLIAFFIFDRFRYSLNFESYSFHRTRYFVLRRTKLIRLFMIFSISKNLTLSISLCTKINSRWSRRKRLNEFSLTTTNSSWVTKRIECIRQCDEKSNRYIRYFNEIDILLFEFLFDNDDERNIIFAMKSY